MIYVDIHEKRSKLPPILENNLHVPIDMRRLDIGDYLVVGENITIPSELKTAEDYLASIESGRLSNELYQMSSAYKKSLLLIHGNLAKAMQHRKINRDTPFQYLGGCVVENSMDGECGCISVINFNTVFDVAIFLKTVHNLVVKDDIIREPDIKRRKIPDYRQKRFTIETLPLVGTERATRLKSRFKTISAVCNASREELQEVEGIGKIIGNLIYDFVNEE